MERLHAGGRKFVVLDFGAPILLTDVYIPACSDWVSITVDVWNRTEGNQIDTDLVRLAVSSDINRRPVVLHDLQPPLVCRFLRLTITGRQGLSASSCKTSIGSFYGHSLILPNDLVVPAMQTEDIPILSREEIMVSVEAFTSCFFPLFNLIVCVASSEFLFCCVKIGKYCNIGSPGRPQSMPLQFGRRSAT
jgi:hypothetical protein